MCVCVCVCELLGSIAVFNLIKLSLANVKSIEL